MDQENELLEISGTVENIIYKNEENGYTVLRLKNDSGETLTVVGCFPYAAAGESMIISGSWTNHSVHGRQFKAEFAQRLLPTNANAIYQFLAGGSVKGVGPATASLIVNRFGDKTPGRYAQLLAAAGGDTGHQPGQGPADIQQLPPSGGGAHADGVCVLLRPSAHPGYAHVQILRGRSPGLSPGKSLHTHRQHDRRQLRRGGRHGTGTGIEEHSKNRIEAAVLFELAHNTGNGHCFIPREKLSAVTSELIGLDTEPDRPVH